jgi:hypothetical protein
VIDSSNANEKKLNPSCQEGKTTKLRPFLIPLPRMILATASKISLMTYHFQKLPQTKTP